MSLSAIGKALVRAAIRLARMLRLPQLLDRLERRLPGRAVVWIERHRGAAKRSVGEPLGVSLEDPLVPEEALGAKFDEVLSLLLERVPAEQVGDYLEFGVYVGRSMTCMHDALDRHGLEHVRLFGFDSFEGLPESAAAEDRAVWRPGMFSAPIEYARGFMAERGVDMERVTLVKGWFDALGPEVAERHGIKRASVIMVDCDLYSSAKDALAFCADLITDEAIILFDDWGSGDLDKRGLGERKAFEEFLEDHPAFEIEELGGYNSRSKVFALSRSAVSSAT